MSHAERTVVVIPVGPRCEPSFVADTVESVFHYASRPTSILMIDDSSKGTAATVAADGPHSSHITVVSTPTTLGLGGGLYLTLSQAYEYVLQHFDFDVLLRLDTDAIVIDEGADVSAAEQFSADPRLGALGRYIFTLDGTIDLPLYPLKWTLWETTLGSLRGGQSWRRGHLLRHLVRTARPHGYQLGENIFGGACFYSRSALAGLRDEGLLGRSELHGSQLQEDHIFSLMLRSLGFGLADFSSRRLPMGLHHKTLPCSPEATVALGKAIVHSTRAWADQDENAIREFYRRRRQARSGLEGLHSPLEGEHDRLP